MHLPPTGATDRHEDQYLTPHGYVSPTYHSGPRSAQHTSQYIGRNFNFRTFRFQTSFAILTGPKTHPALLREAPHL